MKVVIRADSSVAIGTGHIMRCLTLAESLRSQMADVFFVCREEPGNCCDLIFQKGFKVFRLPGAEPFSKVRDAEVTAAVMGERADWLIVDHYALDAEWECRLRRHARRIMVIDDLADRPHDCDLLLDQNLFEGMELRYDGLTSPGCRLFLGPRYALLRDEFIAARRTLRERDGNVRSLLLFFGGSDPTNETEKALQAVASTEFSDLAIDVVVGGANPLGDLIHDICVDLPNATFHRQVTNMAELMTRADLAIGAGGTATWERCFLGLPTLTVVVADNQAKPAEAADRAGLAYLVGRSADVDAARLSEALRLTLQQPVDLTSMAARCLTFMGERECPVHAEIVDFLFEVTDAA